MSKPVLVCFRHESHGGTPALQVLLGVAGGGKLQTRSRGPAAGREKAFPTVQASMQPRLWCGSDHAHSAKVAHVQDLHGNW